MNKKSLLGLLLFACVVTAGLYAGANYFVRLDNSSYIGTQGEADTTKDKTGKNTSDKDSDEIAEANTSSLQDSKEDLTVAQSQNEIGNTNQNNAVDIGTQEPWLSTNPSDIGETSEQTAKNPSPTPADQGSEGDADTEDTFSTSIGKAKAPELIINCDEVDYMSYIPEIVVDSELEVAFDITNPSLAVDAEAAILFDAQTKEILYYKDALKAVFPASTAKLLTALVAMDWCTEDEEVTIGDEIKMIGSGSTTAYLRQGQILTIRNLLAGMLLPSGNDAAYAIAAYVGRKSLQNEEASKEEAVAEFIRLMNLEAKTHGVKNSCFKTPDGYDAIGQYTTAYDMGLIGVAAASNELIVEVTNQGNSRNIFPSGEDVTWYNTNKLVKQGYGQYYSKAIGLKTGTSTMAGRCLVAAAEEDGRKVVCAIMHSSSSGRWEDAIALLKYGLKN
ncbi:MAG: putative rane protein [Herbinix sp.]|nr:putative rane protein [Herbinix sp.]